MLTTCTELKNFQSVIFQSPNSSPSFFQSRKFSYPQSITARHLRRPSRLFLPCSTCRHACLRHRIVGRVFQWANLSGRSGNRCSRYVDVVYCWSGNAALMTCWSASDNPLAAELQYICIIDR